ncbi:MAG: hypothetical protein JO119_10965 [Acidobacteria bacterium]|nr:hypothetical protein [Acidobacteriota bacterium]
MVLTKDELIAAFQKEVHILVHLISKVDPAKIDYRPSAKQRSVLELIQYMVIMAPAMTESIKCGDFTPEAMGKIWGTRDAEAKAMNWEHAVAAVGRQSDEMTREVGAWTDAEFRSEINMFGNNTTRGAALVNMVLCGYAAYRMQLFLYLKAMGREELNTMNLWAGMDGQM